MLQQQRLSESSKMASGRDRSPLRNGGDIDASRIKEEPKREDELILRGPPGSLAVAMSNQNTHAHYAQAHMQAQQQAAHAQHVAAAQHYMVGRHMMPGQLQVSLLFFDCVSLKCLISMYFPLAALSWYVNPSNGWTANAAFPARARLASSGLRSIS